MNCAHHGSLIEDVARRVADAIASFRAARAKRAAYEQTLRELSALSDRELDEIGIRRADIHEVARGAA